MALPISTFAHGEEVLTILLIPVILIIILLIVMYFVKLPLATKGILYATFFTTNVRIFFLVGKLPYLPNEQFINLSVLVVPATLTIGMYYLIKSVKAD
jgi:hypothetical protein